MRDSIRIFAEEMEVKLQRDDAVKPPWEKEHMTSLFSRLLDEVEELADAEGEKNKMLECCDIALYAMMIFSQLHPDTKNNVRGIPCKKNNL